MKRISPDQIRSHNALIGAYFDVVATDEYERFADPITDECTFSLMPIGHTFRGKKNVMDFVTTAGSNRKHDNKSTITITNWFADGSHFCVEYDHSSIVPLLFNRRITIEGYCMVFHMADGQHVSFGSFHLHQECAGRSKITGRCRHPNPAFVVPMRPTRPAKAEETDDACDGAREGD